MTTDGLKNWKIDYARMRFGNPVTGEIILREKTRKKVEVLFWKVYSPTNEGSLTILSMVRMGTAQDQLDDAEKILKGLRTLNNKAAEYTPDDAEDAMMKGAPPEILPFADTVYDMLAEYDLDWGVV